MAFTSIKRSQRYKGRYSEGCTISIARVEKSIEGLVIEGEGRLGYTNRWITK